MRTNDKIIEGLRERRESREITEDVLTEEMIADLMDEIICEAHNASSEARWLALMVKEMLGHNKKIIDRPIKTKMELSPEALERLVTGQLNSVTEQYIKYMKSEIGQFVYGKNNLISSNELTALKDNIYNTLSIERGVKGTVTELCSYLDRVNNEIKKTQILTDFVLKGYGSVLVYNMTNSSRTENPNPDYINDLFKYIDMGKYPEILISDDKSRSIYCSKNKDGVDVLTEILHRRRNNADDLRAVKHDRSDILMKNKYFIINEIRGGRCNVVEMKPLVKAFEEIEFYYVYYMVCSILEEEIGKEAVTVSQKQKQELHESGKSVRSHKDVVVELIHDNLHRFLSKAMKSLEDRLVKNVARILVVFNLN
jgi:hypothetical protein